VREPELAEPEVTSPPDQESSSTGLSEPSEDRRYAQLRNLFSPAAGDACSSKFSCRWPMYLAMAILLLTPFILAGCSANSVASGSDSAEVGVQGFVAGDGSLTLLDTQDREPAPALEGETINGEQFTLAEHVGEVVVLNVWASWCAPCRAEAPALWQVWNDTKDSGVQFVGLVTRDSPASARAFAERFELGYPHVMDDDGSLQLLFRDTLPPAAIPSTLIIDKEGRVAGRALGEVSESSLRGFIEPLLNEPAAGSP
jgi:peroxiredoxin